MTNLLFTTSHKYKHYISSVLMLFIAILTITPLIGCSDGRIAKELDGAWQTQYISSFDDGEKDSTTEVLTFIYDQESSKDNGSFIESRNCKTNELDEDNYTYKIHYMSTVSERYKITGGNLYLNYNLSTLDVKIDRKDVKITPKSLEKAYDMFNQALTVGVLGDAAGTDDDWKQIAESCKKETYKNLFHLYKDITSNEKPYENIKIDGNNMSYDTDDGAVYYIKINGKRNNNREKNDSYTNTDTISVAKNKTNIDSSTSSFSQKMESTEWVDKDGLKIPAFMNNSDAFETDEDGNNYYVYSYDSVILSSSPRVGWTAYDFPDDSKTISPGVYMKTFTYNSKKNLIWSGYTNDGRIFYTAMKEYPEGQVKSSCIWSVIYPKEEQNAVEPIIQEIAKWGKD